MPSPQQAPKRGNRPRAQCAARKLAEHWVLGMHNPGALAVPFQQPVLSPQHDERTQHLEEAIAASKKDRTASSRTPIIGVLHRPPGFVLSRVHLGVLPRPPNKQLHSPLVCCTAHLALSSAVCTAPLTASRAWASMPPVRSRVSAVAPSAVTGNWGLEVGKGKAVCCVRQHAAGALASLGCGALCAARQSSEGA